MRTIYNNFSSTVEKTQCGLINGNYRQQEAGARTKIGMNLIRDRVVHRAFLQERVEYESAEKNRPR